MKFFRLNVLFPMALLAVGLMLVGCGKSEVNKPEVNKVRTAAVVIYTVPQDIKYSSDPTDKETSLLNAMIQAAAAGDGSRAATVSHGTFTEALGSQSLPFRVLTAAEMKRNAAFNRLHQPPVMDDEEKGLMGKMTSMFGRGGPVDGAAPDGLNQYGLAQDWHNGNPVMGTPEELQYIVDSMKALNVDAALVVADPGYSFACEACVGGVGAGSTGSAFMVTMINRYGDPILSTREWFATTDEQAAMAAYAVNPLEHDDLFAEHGRKMAEVFAESFKEKMAEE